jgi:hypothetical protein
MNNIFISRLKNTISAIILSTITILFFKYALKIEINVLRIALVYITFIVFENVIGSIKIKKIEIVDKHSLKNIIIKFSIYYGILCWGITTATIMNLFFNIPFKIYDAILNYILFMAGGFIWGIVTCSVVYLVAYLVAKKIEKKNKSKNI